MPSSALYTSQRTISHPVSMRGVGLHSGDTICLRICPAPADHGVVFLRTDTQEKVRIPARQSFIYDTRLCTTLAHKGFTVATVEHLLSAVVGLQLDNLLVEIDGSEVPIMDGSSAPFVFALRSAGIALQHVKKSAIRILEPVEVKDGEKFCKLLPYDGYKLTMEIDFKHPAFVNACQKKTVDMFVDSYDKGVSRARTFGFVEDMIALQKNNLAMGASLDNAVGFDKDNLVNPPLRYHDEPVTHKILDAIGDLSLLGSALCGEFIGYCSGHRLNKMLVDKLIANPSMWTYL